MNITNVGNNNKIYLHSACEIKTIAIIFHFSLEISSAAVSERTPKFRASSFPPSSR